MNTNLARGRHFATTRLGQYRASCHGRSWFTAKMKATWNVHCYAFGKVFNLDPWDWMFHA